MKSVQTMFFAEKSDIEPVLKNIEKLYEIQYFEMGLFDEQKTIRYNSIFEIKDLGFSASGDWNYDRRLLIVPSNISLNIREVPQRKGGAKYAVDPTRNPVSICLQLGGILKGKENVLVAGKVGIVADDVFSLGIYKSYHSAIKKEFKKIEEFYVGQEAEEKLRLGWRLVLDEGRRKEYDLVIR